MSLLRTRNLHLSFGDTELLDGIDLQVEPGERICLVGRNGSGKSTLLKILAGIIQPDEGEIERQQGLQTAQLEQELPAQDSGTVFDCVAEGLGELGQLVGRFHLLSSTLGKDAPSGQLDELERIQNELETRGGWSMEQQIETVLSRLSLVADADFGKLSGGLQRRVLLARALVTNPDLLLLDEPTNHLDIQAIEWLEEFLKVFPGSVLFITHDRSFLDKLATRIIELDRGQLTDWPGDYQTYLRRKQQWLDSEARQAAEFDRKLAQEERWIRQGIKARRTRNEGRVRALQQMRKQRQTRRQVAGKAHMETGQADQSGKMVIEAINASYNFANRPLIRELNITILRGDKIGIIGPNGIGKTTLLRLLLGELQPDTGTIRQGTRLEKAYFDQRRAQLDEDQSVLDNLSDGRQFIDINGKQRHVISYLQDFLFAPQRVRTPVAALSGGERNRLLLARLFSKPTNLLVLDEPTNDLDIDTLDLLEELLMEYSGTVLLVSHDRAFLDNVVTSSLVFEGDARVTEYVGGYTDWLRQRKQELPADVAAPRKITAEEKPKARPAKLSYRDQRELDQLPQQIEQLETELEKIHLSMSEPSFYQQPAEQIVVQKNDLTRIEADLQNAYRRWDELEQLLEQISDRN
jgi:ATP-binding cassette subfamily F protein uup